MLTTTGYCFSGAPRPTLSCLSCRLSVCEDLSEAFRLTRSLLENLRASGNSRLQPCRGFSSQETQTKDLANGTFNHPTIALINGGVHILSKHNETNIQRRQFTVGEWRCCRSFERDLHRNGSALVGSSNMRVFKVLMARAPPGSQCLKWLSLWSR